MPDTVSSVRSARGRTDLAEPSYEEEMDLSDQTRAMVLESARSYSEPPQELIMRAESLSPATDSNGSSVATAADGGVHSQEEEEDSRHSSLNNSGFQSVEWVRIEKDCDSLGPEKQQDLDSKVR